MRVGRGERKSDLIVHTPELDNWDRVLVVRYPGRRTFFDLVTNPEYLAVMPYQLAALEVVLTPGPGRTGGPRPPLDRRRRMSRDLLDGGLDQSRIPPGLTAERIACGVQPGALDPMSRRVGCAVVVSGLLLA